MHLRKIVRFATACFTITLLPGGGRALAQSRVSSPVAAPYVGVWNHRANDGFLSISTFQADGTWSDGGAPVGTWTVENNQLVQRFNEHSDWMDRFDLPGQNGALKGRDNGGGTVGLTRRSASAPAATLTALAGDWKFFNANDGKRVTETLAASGAMLENGQPTGFWQLVDGGLQITYSTHHEWLDTYDLPSKQGVLSGTNRSGHALSLTRASGGGTTDNLPASVAAAVSTPTKPSTSAPATSSYFGTTRPGAVVGTPVAAVSHTDPAISGVVIPTPVPPALRTPAPRVMSVRPTPTTPTIAPTPLPAAESAAVLTPVGKWHWHAGSDRTFNENGSVLEGTKVTGQWKWINKEKGELQINWSGTHYHPPETYTLSPHGHHLTHSDTEGNAFTDDRVE